MKIGMLGSVNRGARTRHNPLVNLAYAKLRLELNEQAARGYSGFGPWLKEVTPQWTWDPIHFRFSRWYLNKVTSGEIKKLMNFWPPRHGKTEQNTVRYAAFRIEREPTLKVMLVSYNKELATEFSRKVKAIVENRVELNPKKTAAAHWETKAGGGLWAYGVKGVGGGRGFDLIILDDIIKNADEANSPRYRQRMWDAWLNDISKRVNPGCSFIITFTRWHRDDLAGRILESEDAPNWTVVKLPAIAEDSDPMGRLKGEALWPERWSAEWLEATRAVDIYAFESLFQQNPTPPGGRTFEGGWMADCFVDELPAGCSYVRYWDKAGTKGGSGARTAGVLMAKTPKGQYVVCDVEAGRWGAVDREERILRQAHLDGYLVEVWTEQEPGSGGKESAENTIMNLAGYAVHAETVSKDKEVRATPFASQCKVGNVKILRDSPVKRWNGMYLAELETFPQGLQKDMVDASSGAFNKLALVPTPGAPAVSAPRVRLQAHPSLWLPSQELWRPDL